MPYKIGYIHTSWKLQENRGVYGTANRICSDLLFARGEVYDIKAVLEIRAILALYAHGYLTVLKGCSKGPAYILHPHTEQIQTLQ